MIRRRLGYKPLEADAARLRTLMGSEPSGSGSGPNDAQYLVLVVNADLTNERVFTAGDGIDTVDAGAGGAYTVSVDVTDIIGTDYGLTESGNDIRINAGDGLGFDAGALVVDLSGTSGLEFSGGDLQIADSIAGAGLTIASKVLAVGAGTGIAVNADDVALSHLGIENLSDPGADRIFFWDDGASGAGWLAAGTGLSISGTNLNCSVTDWSQEEIEDLVGAMVSGNTETYITVTYQDADGTLDFALDAHAGTHESGGGDEVDHDSLSGFVANEHINHTGVTFTAGSGLTGGGTIASSRTFNVGAGNGITVNANDVALTTPGTLSVSSGNSASGNHTHGITTSSDPGAAASILASAADGGLELLRLGIGTDPDANNSIKMVNDAWIGNGGSNPRIVFDNVNNRVEVEDGDLIVASGMTVGGVPGAPDPADGDLIIANDMRAIGGLYVGANSVPDENDIHFQGNLKSEKTATHDVYALKIFGQGAILTSTSFDGDSFSDVAYTKIDMSSSFGAPTEVKAYLLTVLIRDSGSAGNDCYVQFNDTGSGAGVAVDCSGLANDSWERGMIIVPADGSGDIYYNVSASGTNTFDMYIYVWGYFI